MINDIRSITEKEMDFLVYEVMFENKLIYIGCGKLGREKHVNSGISNNYWLNKHHFNGDVMVVNILKYFNSKKEALEHEKFLISTLKPEYNIKGTTKWKFLVNGKLVKKFISNIQLDSNKEYAKIIANQLVSHWDIVDFKKGMCIGILGAKPFQRHARHRTENEPSELRRLLGRLKSRHLSGNLNSNCVILNQMIKWFDVTYDVNSKLFYMKMKPEIYNMVFGESFD